MPMRPKRILWPTDFSKLSFHGARYARFFAEMFGAELHVVHVIPPPLSPDMAVTMPAEVPINVADDELVEGSRETLARVIEEHLEGIEKISSELVFGNPWYMICRYAEQHEIELIVVTTHGRTGLQHVLIGSTAERIVQHAPCPVLVVKNPEKDFKSE